MTTGADFARWTRINLDRETARRQGDDPEAVGKQLTHVRTRTGKLTHIAFRHSSKTICGKWMKQIAVFHQTYREVDCPICKKYEEEHGGDQG